MAGHNHFRRPVGFVERVFAFWGLGVMLGSLGLAWFASMPFLQAAAWAGAISSGLTLIYLICASIDWMFGPRARRLRSGGLSRGSVARLEKRARQLIQRHSGNLARLRRDAANPDRPGAVDTEAWTREQARFIERVLLAGLTPRTREAALANNELIAGWLRQIERAADGADRQRARRGFLERGFQPGMSGSEYEAFCARILTRAGWTVRNWRDTGDQGVDLVAEKRGCHVAIQCKRYGGSVGNSAVQEIVAGRVLVNPDAHAAVVSNAQFTRAARELAAANHVLLIHHDDLPRLEELFEVDEAIRRAA